MLPGEISLKTLALNEMSVKHLCLTRWMLLSVLDGQAKERKNQKELL